MKMFVLSLLLLPSFCLAQLSKTLFWEISGNELKETSFLYGTIHMVCQDDINFPVSVKNAIMKSQVLYLEVNYEEPINQYKSTLSSLNPRGRNIETYFNKSEIKKLDKLIQNRLKQRLFNYQLLKPQEFHNLIYTIAIPCKVTSYEAEISKVANAGNLKFASLETFEVHEKIASIIDFDYIADIKKFLSSPKKNILLREFSELQRLYESKDIQKMYEFSSSTEKGNTYSKEMINDRNLAWITVIDKSVREKRCFFAFGAAHLAGEAGVINLLKKKGYVIKPILY